AIARRSIRSARNAPMHRASVSRRAILKAAAVTLSGAAMIPCTAAIGAAPELAMPADAPELKFDFEAQGIEGWTTVAGQWAIEDMTGAPSGGKVLVQRATAKEFNVIVAPPGPYADVEVWMKFKPISGRQDASGGIVFRFADGRYYVVRANALEDNF